VVKVGGTHSDYFRIWNLVGTISQLKCPNY